MIIIPAMLVFLVPIWMVPDPKVLGIGIKLCITAFIAFLLAMSLFNLYSCALTEPGIIPALCEDISGIPEQ